jgi:arylsulfatase
MAREGNRFTNFYVAQAVCSASRAGTVDRLLFESRQHQGALPPRSPVGINARELTMGEMFKSKGYATAIFGKWHLGDSPQFLPTRHGFDEYFGLPYSNDMWPRHPESTFPDLPLIDGERARRDESGSAEADDALHEHAVSFIDRHKSAPFFLYVPHSMPHVPLFVSEDLMARAVTGCTAT